MMVRKNNSVIFSLFEAVIVKPNQMQCNHVVDIVVCPKKAPYDTTLSMCMVKNILAITIPPNGFYNSYKGKILLQFA